MKRENIILFVFIFLLSLFVSNLVTSYDFDLFARLEVGEIFFKLHTILKHDPFSYTPTLYWFDHEWGSGVIFYAVLKLIGSAGLIFLHALLICGTIFVIIKHNKGLKYPLIIAAFFIVMLHHQAGQIVRCQAFTFLFTALTVYILEKYRREETRLIWCIPVMVALWCNIHGGVVAGLGIISIYSLLFIIQRKSNALKLLFITILSYAALMINPYGIRYLAYLLYTITLPRELIVDWCSVFHPHVFYMNIPNIIVLVLLLGCKIYRSFQIKKFDIYEYGLIAITMALSILHIKNIPLATIVMFMFVSIDLDYYLEKSKYTLHIQKSFYYAIAILALTLPLTINTPRLTFVRFPITEVEFLKINNIKGNVYAPFGDGGYISYKLYPNNKIFIDGRYDGVYPMKVFDDYINFRNNLGQWSNAINNYPTDIIIVEMTDDIYEKLKNDDSLGWVEIYQSNKRSVFVKKEKAKTSYKKPPIEIEYYRNNAFKTDFVKYIKKEDYD